MGRWVVVPADPADRRILGGPARYSGPDGPGVWLPAGGGLWRNVATGLLAAAAEWTLPPGTAVQEEQDALASEVTIRDPGGKVRTEWVSPGRLNRLRSNITHEDHAKRDKLVDVLTPGRVYPQRGEPGEPEQVVGHGTL